jgi:dTDP-4-dehydrorhamnose 3,5-epimerase
MSAARFDFYPTALAGLMLVQRKATEDERGFFSRFFCDAEFEAAGLKKPIAQINQTLTRKKGAVRGMHFQHPPYAETKIVNCLRGEIFDVAVDLRSGSSTFLHWHAEILSAENRRGLLIPEGFAHGFQALTNDCELIYLHTTAFRPEAEGALNVVDPRLEIEWPLPIAESSERDNAHPFIGADYRGVTL